MPDFPVRKMQLIVEDVHHDGGPAPDAPRRLGAMIACVRNPFAGVYEPDLQSAMDSLKPLGAEMSERLIAALGGKAAVDGYGKGAIVGEAGELEHAALWHVPGGYAMRGLLGQSNAIVPSCMKRGGVGTRLDIPLGHINAAYVRSHFDGIEVGLPDGPKADEVVFALAMSCGGRVHSRMGGLEAWDVTGKDGLR
ncbi:amino acid synthesis family protein [Roseobacter sp. YSTF-M11]|uniref:Amino acid synthesis family protein n=1 Tax=Roseobacter insulae TaxID=2859783 RepID=A0A9X1FUA9_9RHOB|nr:amino acid synthesis family protein [Roseobacter insulae]MBW4707522.1 amino acid synthesis family protein [Roseobacter insulae]